MLEACPLPDELSAMISLVPLCSRVAPGEFPIVAVLMMSQIKTQPLNTAHALVRWNGRLTQKQAIGVAILKFS